MAITTFATPSVQVRYHRDGALTLRSGVPLGRPAPTVLHWLRHWALATPEAVLLTVAAGGMRREAWTYRQAWQVVRSLAAGLIAHGLRPQQRVVVVAPNSFEHLSAGLATMLAGAVYVPIARQYAGPDADRDKLSSIIDLLEPSLLWAADPQRAATLRDVVRGAAPVREGAEGLAILCAPAPSAQISPDDLDPAAASKILLTSGSTGRPKPVAYSQSMMTTNAQMTVDVWPFLTIRKPVLVDWLPWNHAFGGNANVNLVLSQGGTLHVDESGGRPEHVAATLENLRRYRPTFHGAVPAGFAALLPALERDEALRNAFFDRLDVMFSAGAAMHPDVYERLGAVSTLVRGEPVPIVTGWGSTECGPGATMVHAAGAEPGCIGTPLPGVELRLEPAGDKCELLVRGPCVADGYWRLPEQTEAAFTADGYYRTGDAGELLDPLRPERGLRFAGRIADDFKLANGTWVDATGLRTRLLAAAGGGVRDLLVVGADQAHLAVLVWGDGSFADHDLRALLDRHNATCGRSSTRVLTGAVLDPEPSAGELSAKGQLVRAEVLHRRAAVLDQLYRAAGVLR